MRNFATWESLMGGRVSLSREGRPTKERTAIPATTDLRHAAGWDKQKFAQEQIRGMMLQIFFSSGATPTRHVIFSATEAENDVHSICLQVGESLALETLGNIAVVGQYPQICQTIANDGNSNCRSELHKRSTRLRSNLWLVPPTGSGLEPRDVSAASRHAFLSDLRSQFEYSIVAGPPAREWNQAAAMGQLADGVVLVLSAQRTRRIAARNLKEAMEAAQARILGTVFTDRDFPLPESLYRRL
jgi:receptor protein-tyrosine kinase